MVGEVDVNGNVTSAKKFDVYGAARATTGTAKSRQGWVGGLGHQTDPETGYTYMRARYYDPVVGRFASEDPKGDGNNWFIYCAADPINSVDIDGKVSIGIADSVVTLMAAAGIVMSVGEISSLLEMNGLGFFEWVNTIARPELNEKRREWGQLASAATDARRKAEAMKMYDEAKVCAQAEKSFIARKAACSTALNAMKALIGLAFAEEAMEQGR